MQQLLEEEESGEKKNEKWMKKRSIIFGEEGIFILFKEEVSNFVGNLIWPQSR